MQVLQPPCRRCFADRRPRVTTALMWSKQAPAVSSPKRASSTLNLYDRNQNASSWQAQRALFVKSSNQVCSLASSALLDGPVARIGEAASRKFPCAWSMSPLPKSSTWAPTNSSTAFFVGEEVKSQLLLAPLQSTLMKSCQSTRGRPSVKTHDEGPSRCIPAQCCSASLSCNCSSQESEGPGNVVSPTMDDSQVGSTSA